MLTGSFEGTPVPDILYFDDGMWATGEENDAVGVDSVIEDFHRLFPYLQNISRSSKLIWRTETPFKRWVAKSAVPNAGLDMMNKLGYKLLERNGIWVWDTITPYYLKEFDQCKVLWKTGKGVNLPELWACHDYQHPSKFSETIASNLIWNFVCNKIMQVRPNHCCS